jgi:hypothetical protein
MTDADRLTLLVAALVTGKLYAGEQALTDAVTVALALLKKIEAARDN